MSQTCRLLFVELYNVRGVSGKYKVKGGNILFTHSSNENRLRVTDLVFNIDLNSQITKITKLT